MIFAMQPHIVLKLLVSFFSIMFIAFAIKRILWAQRYESDIDKHAISMFLIGLMCFSLWIVVSSLTLVGMRSYLINPTAEIVFKIGAPLFFAIGAWLIHIER